MKNKKILILSIVAVCSIVLLIGLCFIAFGNDNAKTEMPPNQQQTENTEDKLFNGLSNEVILSEKKANFVELEDGTVESKYYLDSNKYPLFNYKNPSLTVSTLTDKDGNEKIAGMFYSYIEYPLNTDNFLEMMNSDIEEVKKTLKTENCRDYFYVHSMEKGFYEVEEITQEVVDELLKENQNCIEIDIEDDEEFLVDILIRPFSEGTYEIYVTYSSNEFLNNPEQ